MSDLYDFANGLIHHPIDTLTGKLDPPNTPKAYTKQAAATRNTASSGISDQAPGAGNVAGGSVGADFDKKTNAAIDAAS
jgi:hypothetical protein